MRTTLRLTALCSAFTAWIVIAARGALASCGESASGDCSDSYAPLWGMYVVMAIVALIGIAIWAAVRGVRKHRES